MIEHITKIGYVLEGDLVLDPDHDDTMGYFAGVGHNCSFFQPCDCIDEFRNEYETDERILKELKPIGFASD